MKRFVVLLIALLMVFSLACSLTADKTPEPEETSAPAKTAAVEDSDAPASNDATDDKDAQPAEGDKDDGAAPKDGDGDKSSEDSDDKGSGTESTGGDGELFHIDEGALDELDSYRSKMTMTFTSADGSTDGNMDILQEATTDPVAQHVLMRMTGTFPGAEDMAEMAAGEAFEVEVIIIEDQQWLNFGGMWLSMDANSADAVDPNSFAGINESFIDPADLNQLGEEDDVEFVGKEKMNGIQTRHYYAEYDSLIGKLGIGDQDIESGEVDVWVADEADLPEFIVRMEFEMVGKLDFDESGGMDGSMAFVMEVIDINQPFTIEVPAEALESGMPEDIPEYPNAIESNVLGGMIAITTEDDEDTVNEFYNSALEEAGWTLGETSILGSSWIKDGRALTLMVTYDADAAITNIIIMTEPGTE
jgi:hypothetical protein